MPRNKKTAPQPLPTDDDLPDLTAQQMQFVRGILEGKTNSDAYRAAYNVAEMQNVSIWVEASRLRDNPKIALWLAAARRATEDRAILTLDGHLGELARLREIALASGNIGAAVLAEHHRGKASALYTERFEDIGKDGKLTDEDLVSRIAEMSPEAGAALARDLGVTLRKH